MLISQVELPVTDVARAAHFYGRRLGLPTQIVGAALEVQVGPSTLVLRSGSRRPGAYHCAFTIPADRFAEAKSWLQQRTALLQRDGQEAFALAKPWNSQSVYFTGPDGTLLELISRHELPASSTGPFTSDSLLCISEVGLVVPDVPAAVATLKDTFELPLFGEGAPDFAAVGDHDGLLIVVQPGRPWFPTTSVTPSPGPVTVTIDAPRTGEKRALTQVCHVRS